MAEMIRVFAVGDTKVPRVDVDGVALVSNNKGRFVARDARKQPLEDGELVPDTDYYRRELAAGSLRLADAAPSKRAGKEGA